LGIVSRAELADRSERRSEEIDVIWLRTVR